MEEKKYIPTIGLEIHAELSTASKMFCSCKNDPDEEKPNANVCEICLGHPGTLPVLNREAIKHVLSVGVAVGGTLADFTEWDRKNYFYPDIPKGYQISQYKYPLVSDGELAGVAIERVHLEEDTAQSTHDTHAKSLVDFNRSGVPLMELVTKPVIHDAATAVRFAKELQLLLRYLSAGEANMEKGEMRVEANISVSSPADMEAGKFGTKTEVKNLNSFRSVERAIEFEVERQIALIEAGEKVVQETRGWDDGKNETYSQRSKESSHDYRYFPDPDIPKMKISEIPEFSVDALKKNMPELPWVKRDRFKNDYGMTDKEVGVFIEEPALADYYELAIKDFSHDPALNRLSANYVLTDVLGNMKKKNLEVKFIAEYLPPAAFAEIMTLSASGLISSRGAKDLIPLTSEAQEIKNSSISREEIAKIVRTYPAKYNLIQKSNSSDLLPTIEKVLADNAQAVSEYKAGKVASLQFLIGMAMKATKGAANPEMVKKLLLEKLS